MKNSDHEQINRRIENFLSRFGIRTGTGEAKPPYRLQETILSEEELLTFRRIHRN